MAEQKVTDSDIIYFIRSYMNKHVWSPSVREICEAVGISSTATMQARLEKLARNKKIIYNGVRQIRVM